MSRKTRKLMWSVPLIAAVAVIGALAAFVALGTGDLFADELPGAPQNLKVAAASGDAARTTLVLNWEAPASGAPDMYRIDVSRDNQKFTFLTEVSGDALTHSHEVRPRGGDSMGKAGWKRYYRVYAMNSHGYGEVSSSESATTKAQAEPGEVGSVTFSSNDPTQITVKWATPDDGGSDILGYCIRAWPTGTDSTAIAPLSEGTDDNANCLTAFRFDGPGGSAGDYRNEDLTTSNDGNNQAGGVIRTDAMKTEYLHKSLRAKEMWSYEVYAFNMHGHSQTSSGVVNGTSAGPKRPTYPGSLLGLQDVDRQADGTLTAAASDTNIINLYWTAANDGGQDIERYEVQISDTPNHWPSEQFLTFDDGGGTLDYVPASATSSKDFAGGGPLVGQLNPDPVDAIGDQANVAVVWVSTDFGDAAATATELAKSYQLRHTYTGSDSDRDDTNDRTFKTKLYYRVRTVAGTGANEMMSPWSRGRSVSVKNVAGQIDDPDNPGTNIERPQFDPPVDAPMLDADANDGLANSSDTSLDSDDENGTTGGGTGTADDDLTPREIKLTISGTVSGADSYRVDVSDDDGATWTTSHEFTLPINKDDYDHRGLKPEEKLSFRFFAKDGSALGLASNVVTDAAGNTNQPGNVRNLVAARHSTYGAGQINLSWDPPATNGGADIEQYCIVANLLGDNDAVGANALERESIFTSNYAAGADGGGTAAITANCTRLGESDAKDKNGVMTIGVPAGDSHVFQVDHDTTMVTFTGLEQETRWQFEVFALNKASDMDVDNNGDAADAGTADPAEDGGRHALSGGSDQKKAGTGSAVAPMAPMRLTAQLARDTDPDAIAGGIGNQGVLILWNPPKDPVGAKVLSYQIERKIDDGEFETEVATHPVGLTHWVDEDELGAEEMREYRVSATNAVGTGTEMATVMIPYPGMHSHKPGVPQSVSATADADNATTIKVTWMAAEANGSAVTGYMLQSQYMMADGSKSEWMNVVPVFPPDQITGMMYEHTGLMPNTTYYYRVRATNANGYGEYSDGMASAMTGDVVPNAPMSVTAAVDDTVITKINVSWGTPADNGGSEVTGYMVQRGTMSSDGTMSWTDVSPAHRGTDMTYMDTGLTPNTKYYYRVAAVNAAGTGEYSDGAANAMTGSADLMVPTDVEASTTGAGELTLTWEGGQNADFFLLLAVDMNSVAAGNVTYDRARVNDPAARTGMVTGLDSGTQYLGIVIAIKGTGADTEVMYETAGLVTVQ